MNALTQAECGCLELVEVIDLKWLLANEGHRIHVERVLADPGYASECLALAETSPSEPVRSVARRLRARLGRAASEAAANADAHPR